MGDDNMRFALLLFASTCILAPMTAYAQAKAYGTSGMDRGQAGIARLQAQQSASASTIEAIAQCGNAGRMYGPGFAGAKSGNCANNLTIRSTGGIAVTGGATIAGVTTLSGTLAVSGTGTFGGKLAVSAGGADIMGNTTLHNNLAVTGTTTLGGATTANGVLTANKGIDTHDGWVRIYGNYGINFADHGGGWYMSDAAWVRSYGNKSIYTGSNMRADGQFQIGSSIFGPPPVCNVNTQKLYWNNGWSCQTTIGGAGAGETDPEVGTLASGKWCYSNGTQVICNQPAPTVNAFRLPPACNATTGKLRWTGSAWECVTDKSGDNLGNHTATTNLNMQGHNIVSAGTVTATAYYQSSDRRLKTDISPIEQPFTLLDAIHGKHYYWKKDGTPAYGVIAQDVEKVMPEAVHTSANGFKSVAYTQLVPVLVEAVKTLRAQNDALSARVHVLEARQ
jgi:hypothetical protein